MFKQIVTFSAVFLLGACASIQGNRTEPEYSKHQPVDFFASGNTQAAFKVTGRLDNMQLEGVLQAKKIGTQDVEVNLFTAGFYRVLQAVVSPEGIAYRYLFQEADTALVRARITQCLDLLFLVPDSTAAVHTKKGETTLTYKGPRAKMVFVYPAGQNYPASARTITTLNRADLVYADYMPISADASLLVPHELVYQDGNITLDLNLISLK